MKLFAGYISYGFNWFKYFVSTDLMGFVICMHTWKISDPWSTKKSKLWRLMLVGAKFYNFWPITPAKKGHYKIYIIVVRLQEH